MTGWGGMRVSNRAMRASGSGAMRASDRDRERAAGVLSDAYAAGRLDLAELRRRAAAVYSARTWCQLRDLTADLPEGQVLARAAPGDGRRGDADRRHEPPRPFPPMLVMAAIWLAIAAAGHVAAAIPLVLLALFVLRAAWWHIPAERRRGASSRRCGMPGTAHRAMAVPAARYQDADAAAHPGWRAAGHPGRCRMRRED